MKALDESIAHWERMRDNPLTCGEKPNAIHCSLCASFLYPVKLSSQECDGCPVYKKTGEKYCDNTPYTEARDAFFELKECAEADDKELFSDLFNRWQRLAQKEIDFLQTLYV